MSERSCYNCCWGHFNGETCQFILIPIKGSLKRETKEFRISVFLLLHGTKQSLTEFERSRVVWYIAYNYQDSYLENIQDISSIISVISVHNS